MRPHWGGSQEGEGRGPLWGERFVVREFGVVGKLRSVFQESAFSPLLCSSQGDWEGAARVEMRHLWVQGSSCWVNPVLSSSWCLGSCLTGNGLWLGAPRKMGRAGADQ